jgi:hypothetical protein
MVCCTKVRNEADDGSTESGLLTTDCLAGYEEFPEKEKVTSSETRLSS